MMIQKFVPGLRIQLVRNRKAISIRRPLSTSPLMLEEELISWKERALQLETEKEALRKEKKEELEKVEKYFEIFRKEKKEELEILRKENKEELEKMEKRKQEVEERKQAVEKYFEIFRMEKKEELEYLKMSMEKALLAAHYKIDTFTSVSSSVPALRSTVEYGLNVYMNECAPKGKRISNSEACEYWYSNEIVDNGGKLKPEIEVYLKELGAHRDYWKNLKNEMKSLHRDLSAGLHSPPIMSYKTGLYIYSKNRQMQNASAIFLLTMQRKRIGRIHLERFLYIDADGQSVSYVIDNGMLVVPEIK